MMGKLATCTVAVKGKEGDGHITINETDFDASIHKKVMVKKAVDDDPDSVGTETAPKRKRGGK